MTLRDDASARPVPLIRVFGRTGDRGSVTWQFHSFRACRRRRVASTVSSSAREVTANSAQQSPMLPFSQGSRCSNHYQFRCKRQASPERAMQMLAVTLLIGRLRPIADQKTLCEWLFTFRNTQLRRSDLGNRIFGSSPDLRVPQGRASSVPTAVPRRDERERSVYADTGHR